MTTRSPQDRPPALDKDDQLLLGGRRYTSRLIVGTGKYKDLEQTRQALDISGAEIVTVALRRVDLGKGGGENLLSVLGSRRDASPCGREEGSIDPKRYTLLPNTAGCYTAEEALRTCRLSRELGLSDLVKLEVIGDPTTLFPDVEATLVAARQLIAEGFTVLPYVTDDPVTCKKLADLGCAAVMPLAAPIGSGLGIRNPHNLLLIREVVRPYNIPVIVDAGVGTASDAAVAMELGCDAVLMNTGIAAAQDPLAMAEAMRLGVIAGRLAFRAGRMPRRMHAHASSPQAGIIAPLAPGELGIE